MWLDFSFMATAWVASETCLYLADTVDLGRTKFVNFSAVKAQLNLSGCSNNFIVVNLKLAELIVEEKLSFMMLGLWLFALFCKVSFFWGCALSKNLSTGFAWDIVVMSRLALLIFPWVFYISYKNMCTHCFP